jgi:predicted ATPase
MAISPFLHLHYFTFNPLTGMITNVRCKAQCFVFTGGPGAGKTTVLDLLAQQGFFTQPEAARQIIREQMADGGSAVPWDNNARYTQLMQERSIAGWEAAPPPGAGPCFFDRGIPDVIGHMQLNNLPVNAALHNAAQQCRYNPQVFIFPPWETIYCTDTERKQSFAEAVRTYEVIAGIYKACGYTLQVVPIAPAPERAAFVLQCITA